MRVETSVEETMLPKRTQYSTKTFIPPGNPANFKISNFEFHFQGFLESFKPTKEHFENINFHISFTKRKSSGAIVLLDCYI